MHSRNSGGVGCGMLLIVPALALIIGPIVAGMAAAVQLGAAAGGVLLLILGAAVITVTRLYRKASSNEAFVRTGQGGQQCVVDGGKLVIPVIHNVIPVSLETMRLDV